MLAASCREQRCASQIPMTAAAGFINHNPSVSASQIMPMRMMKPPPKEETVYVYGGIIEHLAVEEGGLDRQLHDPNDQGRHQPGDQGQQEARTVKRLADQRLDRG